MTKSPETHHEGECLCGTVRYVVEGSFEQLFLCHCSRCRKATGTAHAANLFSMDAKLTWLSGEDQLRVFTVPESRHARTFCAVCGSPMPHLAPSGRLKVPAGSLKTPMSMRPVAHIFDASRADWDHELEDVPRFDERPG